MTRQSGVLGLTTKRRSSVHAWWHNGQVNGDASGESNEEISSFPRKRRKRMKVKQALSRYMLHTFSFLSDISLGPLASALHGDTTTARKTHSANSSASMLQEESRINWASQCHWGQARQLAPSWRLNTTHARAMDWSLCYVYYCVCWHSYLQS